MGRMVACLVYVMMLVGLACPGLPAQAAPPPTPPGLPDPLGLSGLPASTADQDPAGQDLGLSSNPAGVQARAETGNSNSRPDKPAGLPGYSSLAARNYHTCAVTSSWGVQCWGDNRFGQLGEGDTLSRGNPVDVVFGTLTGQVSQVVTGGYHTCALTTTGEVWCWGQNAYGQVGNNTTIDQYAPVKVISTGSTILRLSAGGYHTCALFTAGSIQCWGNNANGQLGDSSTTTRLIPTPVSSLGGQASAVETGWFHTCAVVAGSGVKCWGSDDFGQLGNPATTGSSVPVSVAGLPAGPFSSLAAGRYHTCVLSSTGGLWCWGGNDFGQLGDGTTIQRLSAVPVSTLSSGVLEIGAGFVHTCARLPTVVQCWGSNEFGQLGDNTQVNHSLPAPVTGLPGGIIDLAVGGNHTCVLAGSAAQCWGWNNYGQLGNGSPPMLALPAPVSSLGRSVSVLSTGAMHACAVGYGGLTWCWGAGSSGQLGYGAWVHHGTPVMTISLPAGVTGLAAGQAHTCAILVSGAVRCWGANGSGQLGNNTFSNSVLPVAVSGLASGVVGLASSWDHTCALVNPGGAVKCWGLNDHGQLGDGTTGNHSTPVTVSGPAGGYIDVTAGLYHTCAVTSARTVQCWGDNSHGQLGDSSTNPHLTPTNVPGLFGVAALAAGAEHTCALTITGEVWCWGLNDHGQLGLGDFTDRDSPVLLTVLSGVSQVTAGASHTCAVMALPPAAAGTVRCWGQNNYFQLGTGTPGDQVTPVTVSGLAQGIQSISAGRNNTCAIAGSSGLLPPGALLCWGWTGYGQAGVQPVPWQLTPAAVTDQQVFIADFNKAGEKNGVIPLSLLDFAYHFSAASGWGLQQVEIVSLPASGSLKLGGAAVTPGQKIGYTQIKDLVYQPASSWTGNTSFTWNASDGSLSSPSVATVTLTVSSTPVYLPVLHR
jgi:alpha-tubulin suppressor-like RCC1 family protein